jgi:hypothetical protein
MAADVPAEPEAGESSALQLAIPAGWIARHQVTLELPHTSPDDGDFRANVVMQWARLDLPAATIDAIADERRRLLGRHLPRFEFGLALWFKLSGRRAVRMTYTWNNGTRSLRQVLVLCEHARWLYELTFTDTAVRFAASVPRFDAWLAALELPGSD